ncbi:hypothetical protein SAMN05421824_1939 [Hyunsoonleella jejuensis]|uniref:Uncharacterized protein n=1 Tax=Hyunsoonleella jejuensis TaxID=419940 RepID=A0A1H9GW71_9FLAO|nr:hypothetical protein [Hyunsoonleella jejuensis]SEQ54362.1 hypothetical protein SAMN05421824_1939 [Hyunsoonleella jejuensis]
MKTNSIILISNPCSEQFSTFEQTTAGGFSNLCEKEVIDFRHIPDKALLDYLQSKKENSCGILNHLDYILL